MGFVSEREEVREIARGYMSVSQVAKRLGVGEGMVRHLADTGTLICLRVTDKRIRVFHKDDVEPVLKHRLGAAALGLVRLNGRAVR